MKAIPILVITNALALALAIFLFVKLGTVESQLASRRSDTSGRTGSDASLRARVDQLELQMAERGVVPAGRGAAAEPSAVAPPSESGEEGESPAFATPESEEGMAAGPEAPAGTPFDPQEMEVFRHKVRKALELNAEEDQVNRVAERLDQLVQQNRIAPLTPRQKETVGRIYTEYQRRVPLVWQKLRESGTLENTPFEDRRALVRAEYDNLRSEAQRALEDVMPAADAKTIVDETLPMAQRGFGGPGGAPFGGRRGPGGR